MYSEHAFKQAQANRKAYLDADWAHMMGKASAPDKAKYGYRNGWYTVAGHTFPDYELAGAPMHCPVQAAFAYL